MPVGRERWAAIDRVFDAAIDLPADARPAYLDAACAGDAELRAAVDRLLAAHDDPGGPLDPAGARAAAAWAAPVVARSLGGPAGAPPAPPMPARVGPWPVLARAGEGGMGTVYLAER